MKNEFIKYIQVVYTDCDIIIGSWGEGFFLENIVLFEFFKMTY